MMLRSARLMLLLAAATIAVVASLPAKAEVLASLGTSFTYELATSGRTYDVRQPWSVRGGYRFKRFDLYGEYSQVSSSQSVGYVQIGTRREEILAWGRYVLPKWRLRPFGAVALGTLIETADTQFGSSSEKSKSGLMPLSAVAAGFIYPVTRFFEISIEGRAAAAENFSPNPMLSVGLFGAAKF